VYLSVTQCYADSSGPPGHGQLARRASLAKIACGAIRVVPMRPKHASGCQRTCRARCQIDVLVGLADPQLTSLTKILKCAKDNDVVTLKAADEADSLGLVFEAISKSHFNFTT
jgi:hypothetical protein